jgi:probable blue pigment (indigoidine) exporter
MSSSPSYRHVLMLVGAAACWGCGTVLSKLALDRGIAPLLLLAIELAASCVLLSTVALALRATWSWSRSTRRLTFLGILNPGLAYALGLLGLVSISASMSVLLWATEPVLILLLAVLVLRERVGPTALVALATALGGVVLVVYRPGAGGDAVGIALTVAAVTACACYTVLTRRLLLDDSSVAVVLLQQAAALVFALVLFVGAAVGGVAARLPTDPLTWALAAASGMVYYGAAFWLFVSGLRGVPASLAGAYLPLIPVFGLAAGYAAGDRLVDRQWLGALLVVLATAAAAVHQLRRRRVTRHW